MGFSKKIQAYLKSKNLTHKELSNLLGGYSTVLISRYINSDEVSLKFVDKLIAIFPDLDYSYLLGKEDEIAFQQDPINYVEKNSDLNVLNEPPFLENNQKRLTAKEEIQKISDKIKQLSMELEHVLSRI